MRRARIHSSKPRGRCASVGFLVAFALVASGCGSGSARGGKGVGDACATDTDCARGLSCTNGQCALPDGATVCTPGTRFCDASDVLECDAAGSKTTLVTTCASGCADGACLDPTCTEGATRCATGGVEICARTTASQLAWKLLQSCPLGCDNGQCKTAGCKPLDVRCKDGAPGTVQLCAGDGSTWLDRPCADNAVCVSGACESSVCNAGDTRCGAAGVELCAADPSGGPLHWTLALGCPLGCDPGTGTCKPGACRPLDVRCKPGDTGTAQLCLADGSGYVDRPCGGTQCDQGVCGASTCSPGATRCGTAGVETCVLDNSSGLGRWTVTQGCPQGCDSASAACTQTTCRPLSVQCAPGGAATVEVCRADGSGYTDHACDSGQECVAAVCQTPACTLGATRCGAAGVESCVTGPRGAHWSTTQGCPLGCDSSGAAPACNTIACRPLETRCVTGAPTQLETCTADGKSFTTKDCDAGRTCVAGACVATSCTEGATRCGTSGIETCRKASDGTFSWTMTTACPLGCDTSSTTCVARACRPLDVRCKDGDPHTAQVCANDGSGFVDKPCESSGVCVDGVCSSQLCTPGTWTCDGSTVEQCDAQGLNYINRTPCAFGCANGACQSSGSTGGGGAVCSPGDSKCDASKANVLVCRPDGSGFTQGSACGALGCIDLGQGRAACAAPVCNPLARRCAANGTAVEVCAGDGSGWVRQPDCSDGCANGVCLPPPGGCTQGAVRCAGSAVQQCDGTGWVQVADCLDGCTGAGVCAGGSCSATSVGLRVPLPGCASGNEASPSCTLAASDRPPADGASTLLAIAEPLLDLNGNPVADGTEITVAATGGAAITAPDVDPDLPGVQVRAFAGRADFAFRAPPASQLSGGVAPVTVTAALGRSGDCAASLTLSFVAPGNVAYAAEDFTTLARRDPLLSSADWRTDTGHAETQDLPYGTGADGALTVPAARTWNLSTDVRPNRTFPDGATLKVLALTPNGATVSSSDAFQPGDEVLLIELQGASLTSTSGAGTWELHTLASAQGGLLTFTTPVAGTFGNKVGAALAGEKVEVVRVPQFTDVTIPATSALSASAWDGTLGGVVVFRATGTVQLDGAIHADGIGFRQGSSASTSTPQQAGESYGGQPANGVSGTNLGAGGGGFNLCETAHLNQNDSWFGAGGSYGSTGVSGSSNPSAICATSVQGLPYGTPTLARMFLGSGSGTQVNNTHAACSDAICPSESRSTYTTAFKSNALSACDTATNPSCAATFAACPAETQSFGAARFKNGASSCDTSHNPTCAATFATCGGGSYNISVGHGAASSSFDGRTFGNWADTSLATTCGAYTLSHVAAQASNDSRFSPSQPAWNDTHAFCSGFESAHSAASHAGGTFTSSTPNITVWNDTNSFCSAFNVSSASSYTQAGNTCTGACAQTAAACGTYNITYGAASASNDGRFSPSQSQWNLTTGLCNTSNSGHSSYYDAPASACGSTCADTRAFCSPYQSSAVAASKSNDGRFSPSSAQWTATNALCGSSNVGFSAATRPCAAGTNSCSNTFASCSIYTNNIGSASCSGTCPSAPVNNPSSCTSCGCGIWNQHDCFQAECVNSYPGHCGSSDGNPDGQKNHEISDGCETTCSLGFSCPNSEDRCTSTGCGFLGLGSPCYRPVYRCWNGPSGAGGNCPGNGSSACNSCCFAAANNSTCVNSPADSSCNGWCQTNSGCTTNPGCETNPGCTYNPGCTVNPGCTNNPGCTSSPGCNSNPGCTTNVGCTMNPGCHTCGGCDYTAPGNTCACPAPDQKVADGGRGGGIVFIIASRVVVGTSGRISAVGADPAGGSPSAPNFAGGSGGSLWLRAGTLTLPASASTMTINARGGKNGGDGRIRLERVNGDDPVARSLIAPAPYLAPFLEPQIVGRPLLASTLASAGKKVTALQLVAAIDGLPLTGAPLVQHDYSLNAGASWTTLTLGQDAPITPTNDVRFRAHFVPRAGNVPQTSGLVWRLKLQ